MEMFITLHPNNKLNTMKNLFLILITIISVSCIIKSKNFELPNT